MGTKTVDIRHVQRELPLVVYTNFENEAVEENVLQTNYIQFFVESCKITENSEVQTASDDV